MESANKRHYCIWSNRRRYLKYNTEKQYSVRNKDTLYVKISGYRTVDKDIVKITITQCTHTVYYSVHAYNWRSTHVVQLCKNSVIAVVVFYGKKITNT